VTTPQIATPQVTTPQVTTPQVTTPQVATPQVTTPQVTTPQVTTPQVTTPQVTPPQVTPPQVTPPQVATPRLTTPQPDPQPVVVAKATPSIASTVSPTPVVEIGGQEAAPLSPVAPRAETEPLPTPVVRVETKKSDPAPTPTGAHARALPQSIAALPGPALPVEMLPVVVVPPEEPVPDPDPYASLPSLRHLSYQIQTALPDLPILVHVYGEDASARFVVIRHKRYREGDPLGDNLTLEAITPSGAVLRYRDTSFRIDR
jgi:hypothetical protein